MSPLKDNIFSQNPGITDVEIEARRATSVKFGPKFRDERVSEAETTKELLPKFSGQGRIEKRLLSGEGVRMHNILQICALADHLTGKTAVIDLRPSLTGLTHEEAKRAVEMTIALFAKNPELNTYEKLISALTSEQVKRRRR